MENTLVSFDFLKKKIEEIEELKLKLKELTKRKIRDEVKLTKTHDTRLKIAHDQYVVDMRRIQHEKKVRSLNRVVKKQYLKFSNVRNNNMV